MGRKPKLVSEDYPLAELELDVRKYYRRLTAQADEMYRKAKWQVEPGGPYESAKLLKMANAANSLSKQARSLHYKRWRDYVQDLLNQYCAANGVAAFDFDEVTEDQLVAVFLAVKNPDTVIQLGRNAREVYGRSLEVAFLYEKFTAEIDVTEVNPNKKKAKKE